MSARAGLKNKAMIAIENLAFCMYVGGCASVARVEKADFPKNFASTQPENGLNIVSASSFSRETSHLS